MSPGIQSRTAFGRRDGGVDAPTAPAFSAPIPTSPAGRIARRSGLTILLLIAAGLMCWTLWNIERLNGENSAAQQNVVAIVNQPVTHLPRSGPVELFSPGWFHPGAMTPDFSTVDVRTTQQFPYNGSTYVSSDLNPSEMFIGSELEFNPMTKYFYTDRTLPKKRLSEAEMIKINGLYRVIGRDEEALFRQWLIAAALFVATACLVLVLFLPLSQTRQGSTAVSMDRDY
jgi:hypothetical protein